MSYKRTMCLLVQTYSIKTTLGFGHFIVHHLQQCSFLFIPHPHNPGGGNQQNPNQGHANQHLLHQQSLVRTINGCDIVLPSNSNNDNIIWKAEYQSKDSVPTGSGFTSKSRFSTDTIMVSTEHAGVRHENGHFVLQNIGKNCSCFIRRDDSIFALTPPQTPGSEKVQDDITLQNSDLLYIGNRLFRVQLNVQRNEPHLDPSRFIHEAFPTHVEASPTDQAQSQPKSDVESLAAQAKRFFAPKQSHASQQDSLFPDSSATQPKKEQPKPNLEQQVTKLEPQSKATRTRPSNRLSALSDKRNPQSAKTISLIEPVVEADQAPPLDIPEYLWELSLSASHQVRLLGWLIKGTQRVGNTADHDIIVPENRIQPNQVFTTQDYCTIHYRRGTDAFSSHRSSDLVVDETESNKASKTVFHIIRRGIQGSEDFRITLKPDVSSIIPSSMSLSIDRGDETVHLCLPKICRRMQNSTPFRFSSTDIRCSVQGEELVVESAHELRLVRIDLNGNIIPTDAVIPLEFSNEKAIIDQIIQWHLPS